MPSRRLFWWNYQQHSDSALVYSTAELSKKTSNKSLRLLSTDINLGVDYRIWVIMITGALCCLSGKKFFVRQLFSIILISLWLCCSSRLYSSPVPGYSRVASQLRRVWHYVILMLVFPTVPSRSLSRPCPVHPLPYPAVGPGGARGRWPLDSRLTKTKEEWHSFPWINLT